MGFKFGLVGDLDEIAIRLASSRLHYPTPGVCYFNGASIDEEGFVRLMSVRMAEYEFLTILNLHVLRQITNKLMHML